MYIHVYTRAVSPMAEMCGADVLSSLSTLTLPLSSTSTPARERDKERVAAFLPEVNRGGKEGYMYIGNI